MKKLLPGIIALWLPCNFTYAQMWSPVGPGLDSYVEKLIVHNGNVYASGSFQYSGSSVVNLDNRAVWNGSNWLPIGNPAGINLVECLASYNGNLYLGGQFHFVGTVPINNIVKWDGNSWDSLGSGIASPTNVNALCVYNNELYSGGWITGAGGIPLSGIARWNGTNASWDSVSSGIDGTVYSFLVSNNELYVGGSFNYAGGINVYNLAKWNGTSWSALSWGVGGPAFALAEYNGELYVGGSFMTTASGVPARNIAKWNGTNWLSVGAGINGTVLTMAVFNGDLFVGGIFDSAGSVHATGIAKWDGANWSSIGSGIHGDVHTLFADGAYLYAGGAIDTAGGIPVINIAKWGPCSANFLIQPTATPHNWIATNYSVGTPPLTYVWDWGDGSATSTGSSPSHTYTTAGAYTICVTMSDGIGCTSTYCDSSHYLYRPTGNNATVNITVIDYNSLATAVNEIVIPKISIYPNPVNSKVTVESDLPKNNCNMYDITGRLLLENKFTSQTFEIDISDFKAGIYFLTVDNGVTQYRTRIIKQ